VDTVPRQARVGKGMQGSTMMLLFQPPSSCRRYAIEHLLLFPVWTISQLQFAITSAY
jgi:hypothetical protein